MKHPDFLDNRDFTGEDKKRPSTMSMDSSYQALEGAVKKLSEIASTSTIPATSKSISKRESTWPSPPPRTMILPS